MTNTNLEHVYAPDDVGMPELFPLSLEMVHSGEDLHCSLIDVGDSITRLALFSFLLSIAIFNCVP